MKKLIQLMLCYLLFFIGSIANASSMPTFDLDIKLNPTSATTLNLASSMGDYGNLSTYLDSLV